MSIVASYNAESLRPYSELPDITDPAWDPDPLVVVRQGAEGQHLVALGLAHRTDRGNRHYRTLTEYAADFMTVTTEDKRVIINEGGVWPIGDSLDVAYAAGGEAMWLQTYGKATNTPVVSPELPNDGADLMLAEGFTKEEIACFYFVRQVPQFGRITLQKKSFEEYIQDVMTRKADKLGWDFDFSLSNLIATYEDMYGKRFDRAETRFFYEQSVGYMLEPTTRIQKASIVCNMGRDINLLHTQQEYFNRGISSLTGFGWSHVYALQPRIEQMGTHGESSLVVARNLGSLAMNQHRLP